ncbi:MAG: Hsp20/alpha crystallin family protein [Candidatus Thermoplasmatota archaeon]|nr:Hsp20/alpha crystallin family protein [Candidatus Thermoplasmatota archaeon]
MDPYKRDRNRRRKNPFDQFGFDDDFFNDFFDDRLFDDFRRMAEEMMRMMSQTPPAKPFVHGYKLYVGPDGKPHLEDFGNKPVQSEEGQPSISEEREPLTDVIDCGEAVSVTVEIPGVEKEDIDLNVTEDELEITVDTPQRKYHKIVNLPADVMPKTTKATYKNGVLDVIIQKKELKKDNDKGYKVNID